MSFIIFFILDCSLLTKNRYIYYAIILQIRSRKRFTALTAKILLELIESNLRVKGDTALAYTTRPNGMESKGATPYIINGGLIINLSIIPVKSEPLPPVRTSYKILYGLFNPTEMPPTLPINDEISPRWNGTLFFHRLILRAINKRNAHT
ncbi:hypothetical protein IV03_16265 [Pseudomonas congelans]|nr:hypothetical protein IV03_16265 [Pseudomonas congelans]